MRTAMFPVMKRLSAVVALLAAGVISAAADTYAIDPAHSRIAFSVRHFLGSARGEFRKFSGMIEVDRAI